MLTKERKSSMTQEQAISRSVYQLRIYEVSPDKKEIFHDRFKNHALRIMKRYGFEVVALWESSSVINFEFIYILKWSDAVTMERQWKLFLADEEWIAIKKKTVSETGEPVLKATGRLLSEVEYSPPFNPT
jgi:heme-degrading monooxygenase HmoA